jgi:hypothetical protein
MPRVGFEQTIPVFERKKTGHALDRAASVTGPVKWYLYVIIWLNRKEYMECSSRRNGEEGFTVNNTADSDEKLWHSDFWRNKV